jgi:2-keto-3-deoxy-6-phosphogluconate aldolase
VTRLPAQGIGDAAVRAVRAEGVRTDFIQRGGRRVGIYFAEAGAVAVGVGSALLDTKAIAAKQFAVIEANARRMVANVAAARSG